MTAQSAGGSMVKYNYSNDRKEEIIIFEVEAKSKRIKAKNKASIFKCLKPKL